jgi:hypothetical protein
MKIYIVQYLDSLLDYSDLRVYTDKQEAIEAFTLAVAQAKVEDQEVYSEGKYHLYYNNGESNSKISIEEHTIQ